MAEYAALAAAARRTGAKIFVADEAHFRADADLRGKWVLKGEPALVDSTSPRRGEKERHPYLIQGQLLLGGVSGDRRGGGDGTGGQQVTTTAPHPDAGVATSVAFLRQLRARHTELLTVIWDNTPAHRGDAVRAYLATPGLNLRLVNPVSSTGQALPSYSPDFNADEAIWGWARQKATANRCLGTLAVVQEMAGDFFARLSSRREEVKSRWRTCYRTTCIPTPRVTR